MAVAQNRGQVRPLDAGQQQGRRVIALDPARDEAMRGHERGDMLETGGMGLGRAGFGREGHERGKLIHEMAERFGVGGAGGDLASGHGASKPRMRARIKP